MATRKPLTNTTWESVNNRVMKSSVLHWDQQCDLGYELAEMTSYLDVPQSRLLVDYTCSGFPLILTWTTRARGAKVQTTKANVIVEWIDAPAGETMPGKVRVRYPGFAHYVYIPAIVSVEQFNTEYTFDSK